MSGNSYHKKSYDPERVKNAKLGSNWISKGSNKTSGAKPKSRKRGGKGGGDSDNEASIPVDYDDEDEGGSSQDAYESDFINDGKDEEEVKQKTESEEEYYTKSHMSVGSQDVRQSQKGAEEEDDEDPYIKLPLAEGQEDGGFKYDAEDPMYYLPEGFCLKPSIYENLFEH